MKSELQQPNKSFPTLCRRDPDDPTFERSYRYDHPLEELLIAENFEIENHSVLPNCEHPTVKTFHTIKLCFERSKDFKGDNHAVKVISRNFILDVPFSTVL